MGMVIVAVAVSVVDGVEPPLLHDASPPPRAIMTKSETDHGQDLDGAYASFMASSWRARCPR
jgi:hypothetical protein